MNENKRNSGITLIALIVTIIVLLILAGVTMATLTGENGILTQASKAKTVTSKAEMEEQIKLAVMAAKTNVEGTIDLSVLEEELGRIGTDIIIEKQGTDEMLPWYIKTEVGLYQITEEGQVGALGSVLVTAQEIATNPKAYYGKKVENYKASESDTNTYRIFYVDTANYFGDGYNTIYLKADYGPVSRLDGFDHYDLSESLVVSMNPGWAEGRGSKEGEWRLSEKAAAYLCSPVNSSNASEKKLSWKSCYMNNANVNYVIGAPSVEMYVKSYSQAYRDELNDSIDPIEAVYSETDSPGYIYKLNTEQATTTNNGVSEFISLGSEGFGGMYFSGASLGKLPYLASPSSCGSGYLCVVGEDGLGAYPSGAWWYDYSCCLSPLVSLKSNFAIEVLD